MYLHNSSQKENHPSLFICRYLYANKSLIGVLKVLLIKMRIVENSRKKSLNSKLK